MAQLELSEDPQQRALEATRQDAPFAGGLFGGWREAVLVISAIGALGWMAMFGSLVAAAFAAGAFVFGSALVLVAIFPALLWARAARRTYAYRVLGSPRIVLWPPDGVQRGGIVGIAVPLTPSALRQVREARGSLVEEERRFVSGLDDTKVETVVHARMPLSFTLRQVGGLCGATSQAPIATFAVQTSAGARPLYRFRLTVTLELRSGATVDVERDVMVLAERVSAPRSSPPSPPTLTGATSAEPVAEGVLGRCPRDRSELGALTGVGERDCPKCHGVLVAGDGLGQLVLEPLGISAADYKELIRTLGTSRMKPLACAACGGSTVGLQLKGVPIDACAACGAAWLDEGERARLTRWRDTAFTPPS